jgi:ABC-type transporter Mla subunit MlaD
VPFRLRYADRLVGVFLLSTALILVVTLISIVRSQELFKRRIEYKTVFDDGGGIKPQTPVTIAGIEVGKVRRVHLTEDNRVEVRFDILIDYVDRIVGDPPGRDCTMKEPSKNGCGSRVAASVPAGLGAFLPTGGGLTILVGKKGNPSIEAGGFVQSEQPEGLNEILARLQHEGVVQNAKDIVEQVALLLRRINDTEGPIWRSVENVQAVTARAKDGKGIVGQALNDQSDLSKQVRASLESLERSLQGVEKSVADVNVVTDSVKAKEAEIGRVIANLEKFSDEARSVGVKLGRFSDEAEKVPPDLRATIANLDKRIDDLGVILRGLKKSFPLNMVVDQEADAGPTPAAK